jgi:hypothetical protein
MHRMRVWEVQNHRRQLGVRHMRIEQRRLRRIVRGHM